MDIKEIAEQVSKRIYVEDGLLLSKFISEKFAEAIIESYKAELLNGVGEPVGYHYLPNNEMFPVEEVSRSNLKNNPQDYVFLYTSDQLAAEQLNNKLLRDALQAYIDEHEECQDADDWMAMMCSMEAHHAADEALSQPSDTSALDSFVAEKVKESHKVIPREGLVPHAYQLEATHNNAEYWYKLGHSKEAAEKGESVICMAQAVFAWRNAAYAKAEEVTTITKQRDLAVEALENCRLLAARHRKEEWAGHIMRFCKDAGLSGSPIRNDSIKESEAK